MDKSAKLELPFPAVGDKEDNSVPPELLGIIDTHVHVFPEPVFKALWEWFEKNAWPIRYQGTSFELLEYLLTRGVAHIVALQYAHKPGIARDLNRYMLDLVRQFSGRVTGLATVFPGERDAALILEEAFDAGLNGVKLHAHVQCFDMNSPDMDPIYDTCSRKEKPMVMHVGREPKSESYLCDPYVLCRAEKLEQVLKDYPDLKVCVPHLGMDEYAAYQRLTETYDNLWLDTSVACADFLPTDQIIRLDEMRIDRIMYGSDYPNIPYAWDREIKQIKKTRLSEACMDKLFTQNARQFFNLDQR
jgi:uncharacterized protein